MDESNFTMPGIEGQPPNDQVPIIWGDYNAIGLSGEPDDNCIYSLHRERLAELKPTEGLRVFVYEDDVTDNGDPEVFGYVCVLEEIDWATSRWRARPEESTWYRGPNFWGGSVAP